ncbi:MAG: hypothetical protein ACR2N8_03040 [Parvibaculales bacterium]
MGSVVKNLGGAFKGGTRSVQNPYASNSSTAGSSSSTTDTEESNIRNLLSRLSENQSTASQGTSGGLADTSLTDPLAAHLRGVDFGTGAQDASLLDSAIQRRVAGGTPAGYATARSQAKEDYANTIREIGHRGARIGRGGDATERANRIAQSAFADRLLQGYDTSQNENDAALAGLIQQRQGIRSEPATQYSGLLSRSPFARASAQTQDIDRTQDQATEENSIRELLSKIGSLSSSKTNQKGFNTQTFQTPSLASQLASLASGVAGVVKAT